MRQYAKLVVALLVVAWVLPVAAATTPGSAPACCRTAGKHHCSMGREALAEQGGFNARSNCPYQLIHLFWSSVPATSGSFGVQVWDLRSGRSAMDVEDSPIPHLTATDLFDRRGPPLFLS